MLAISLSSSVALANPAEDMERAKDFYSKQQLTDAAVIYKKLAFQNYLPAQAMLGELLNYTEAPVEATGWFIMAAFQGDPTGAYGLARSYAEGLGIKKDPEQALYWFKFAADKDNLASIIVLENAYRKGDTLPVPVDLKQAEFWKSKRDPLEAAEKKAYEERLATVQKQIDEKKAATKKADEEAAKKSR
jgi:TPR repeat protein